MTAVSKPVYSVAVRDLIQFVLHCGDLGGKRDFVGSDRVLAGTRGHQRIQRSRPPDYQKEISLAYDLQTEEFILRIRGRIDGLTVRSEESRRRRDFRGRPELRVPRPANFVSCANVMCTTALSQASS